MSIARHAYGFAVLLSFSAACSPAGDDPSLDSIDDATEAADGKADTLGSTSTYYGVRPDLRRCVSPFCGGWWVQRLNHAQTRCFDGSYASECYVASIDVSALGLSDAEATDTVNYASAELFRGSVGSALFGSNTLGQLVATEAWRNGSSETTASGVYYRVDPNAIRCITTPCPEQFHEAKLNSTRSTTLVGFTGPFADKLDSALQGADSLLVAGSNQTVHGKRRLDATQFWTRIAPAAAASAQ